MSVEPITVQEVTQCHPLIVPDEVYEVINYSLCKLWHLEHEVRIIDRELVEKAFRLCGSDAEKIRLLKNFFHNTDWWYKVVLDYSSAGWKVKHDSIIEGLYRFVFTVW